MNVILKHTTFFQILFKCNIKFNNSKFVIHIIHEPRVYIACYLKNEVWIVILFLEGKTS